LSNAASEIPSVQWRQTFNAFQGNSVIQTTDGGYAIAGSNLKNQAVLIKTDSSGNLQWEKDYGTDIFGSDTNAVSVVQTKDSGYVLFGEGGYLVKLDAEGNFQWKKTIGVGGVCVGILASDGTYLVAGNNKEVNGDVVAWLIKTNDAGDILLNKTFTGGVVVNAAVETDDRGYAMAGYWKNDFWFAKVDSNNNLQWTQTYSYGGTSDTHSVSSIAKTKDGGYILAGAGDWQASGGLVPWLIKIDFQGHERWDLPYGHMPQNGFSSVVQTEDEGYLVALSNSPILDRTDSSGSEEWNIVYADVNLVGLNYHSSSLIRTSDGGYAIVATSAGSTIWLAKISPEPEVSPPTVSVLSPQNKTYDTNEVSLIFTVNKAASWFDYSLDGHDNVSITGNTTLTGLADGDHILRVYVRDATGNAGTSETVRFSVARPFPIVWVVVSVVVVVVAAVGVLVFFKKLSLRGYFKGQSPKSLFKKQSFSAIVDNRMIRTLIIISVCIMLVLVQVFFPYYYFASSSKSSNSSFEVGVTYVYEQDSVGQIYDQVSRIHDLGFRVIRVNMVCDSTDPNAYVNSLTDIFFSATQQLGVNVALIIQNHDDTGELQYYLGRWGTHLSYVQILNEPESSSSWDVGALFTDDEAISKFEQIYSTVEQFQLSVQLYTNFGAGFVVRSNLPIKFSEKLDFVGLDIFMDSFLTMSPNFVQLLHKVTNKDVVITEFGMSTIDDAAQSDYIIKGLNLFKNMGLRGCWLVYWNSETDYYGIRGRLAEKTVGEWIAQNAKT
jgi:hypothetical protein